MAHQLDERSFVTRLDPKEMLRLTEEFPRQCREGYEIAMKVDAPLLSNSPNLVVLTGLGGSAAGGDFARGLFEKQGATPFFVNRDYNLPHFVGLGDLVIAASYSGNTEETLSAYADAKKAGAVIIAVTSGGQLAEMARADGYTVVSIPGGQPPRTALGYMLMPVLVMCQKLKLIPEQPFEVAFALLESCAKRWTVEAAFESNPTKQLAAEIYQKLPIIYGLGSWQGLVANRWKGQINENAKVACFSNTFPELNHNEILGWVNAGKEGVSAYAGIILESGDESDKMRARAEITEKLIGSAAQFHHVKAEGETLLEKLLSLTFFGDFTSIYLAALYGVDPENIDSINKLKDELAKVG